MVWWWRSALMCLLVVALPVQSWAAATLFNCGPTHHRMVASATLASGGMGGHFHDSQHHRGAAHAGHSPAHESAAPDMQDLQPIDSTESDADDHSLQKLGKFKCSACASCCLGLALPSNMVCFDASVSTDTFVPGMPQAVVVFLTSGLERPPRTRLV